MNQGIYDVFGKHFKPFNRSEVPKFAALYQDGHFGLALSGGCLRKKTISDISLIDERGVQRKLGHLNFDRWGSSLTRVSHYLATIGGCARTTTLACVEAFSLTTLTTSSLAPLNNAR